MKAGLNMSVELPPGTDSQAIAEDMGRELRIPVIALSVDILIGPGADLSSPDMSRLLSLYIAPTTDGWLAPRLCRRSG